MKDLMTDDATIDWLGVRYKTILTTEESGGAMSIVDSLSPVDGLVDDDAGTFQNPRRDFSAGRIVFRQKDPRAGQ